MTLVGEATVVIDDGLTKAGYMPMVSSKLNWKSGRRDVAQGPFSAEMMAYSNPTEGTKRFRTHTFFPPGWCLVSTFSCPSCFLPCRIGN